MKLTKHDQKQLNELKNGGYDDASLHIVILDLCLDTSVEDVFTMLHNVASDMGKKKELEGVIEKSKTWKWAKYGGK